MRALVALVGLAAVLLAAAPCRAQAIAGHDVRIAIPAVLRLRLDDADHGGTSMAVPLGVAVEDGVARIDPSHSRLRILANTHWQVAVAFDPSPGSESLDLGCLTADGVLVWHRTSAARVVLHGAATAGWRDEVVRYVIGSLPPAGHYGGLLTYTLTRP